MTKEEFEELVGKSIPNDEWREVENVYTNSTFSKDTVAAMYIESGISVFLALQDYADYKEFLEADLRYFKKMVDLTNERISRLHNGDFRVEKAIRMYRNMMTVVEEISYYSEISELRKIQIVSNNIVERFGEEVLGFVNDILNLEDEGREQYG